MNHILEKVVSKLGASLENTEEGSQAKPEDGGGNRVMDLDARSP